MRGSGLLGHSLQAAGALAVQTDVPTLLQIIGSQQVTIVLLNQRLAALEAPSAPDPDVAAQYSRGPETDAQGHTAATSEHP